MRRHVDAVVIFVGGKPFVKPLLRRHGAGLGKEEHKAFRFTQLYNRNPKTHC